MPRKLSETVIINSFQEKHGGHYQYLQFPKIFNLSTIIDIICPIHGVFQQKIRKHKEGQGCPKCGHRRTTDHTLISRTEWLRRFESVHGKGKYDYSKVPKIVLQNVKVEIYCPEHNNTFFMKPDIHWRFKQGCFKCGHIKKGQSRKMNLITRRKYEQQAKAIHGLAFEYSELPLEFSLNDNIIIYCNEHNHIFFCKAKDHLNGTKCQHTS